MWSKSRNKRRSVSAGNWRKRTEKENGTATVFRRWFCLHPTNLETTSDEGLRITAEYDLPNTCRYQLPNHRTVVHLRRILGCALTPVGAETAKALQRAGEAGAADLPPLWVKCVARVQTGIEYQFREWPQRLAVQWDNTAFDASCSLSTGALQIHAESRIRQSRRTSPELDVTLDRLEKLWRSDILTAHASAVHSASEHASLGKYWLAEARYRQHLVTNRRTASLHAGLAMAIFGQEPHTDDRLLEAHEHVREAIRLEPAFLFLLAAFFTDTLDGGSAWATAKTNASGSPFVSTLDCEAKILSAVLRESNQILAGEMASNPNDWQYLTACAKAFDLSVYSTDKSIQREADAMCAESWRRVLEKLPDEPANQDVFEDAIVAMVRTGNTS